MSLRRVTLILAAAFLVAALPDATSGQSPEAAPSPTCAFPPVSIELLREIETEAAEQPIPTPTTLPSGAWSSELHQYGYPPPAGEPLDDETVASVQVFLGEYQTCLESGDIVRIYGAWTEPYLRLSLAQHPDTIDPIIEVIESDLKPFAHPGLDLLLLRAWWIETGHVVGLVQIVDTPQYWTLFLAPVDDSWRIDDIWDYSGEPMGEDPLDDNLTGPVYGTPIALD
jgi:hypothetical protein